MYWAKSGKIVVTTAAGSATSPATLTIAVSAPPVVGNAAAGKSLFVSTCAACHTLKAAGAQGTLGPNLDEKKPPVSLIIDRVTHGKGVMPSFAGQLSAKQIADVAAFVYQSTHS